MRPSLKITLIYLTAGVLWILLSDWLLLTLFKDRKVEDLIQNQIIKGVFYVSLTGLLLYFLIKKYYNEINQKVKKLEELNQQLKEQTKKLEQSNHELEQFAHVASHDLIEPLRMITGFISMLEKKYAGQLDEKAQQYIFFAVDGAKRMRHIILDLLDYSKAGTENLELEIINLNNLTEEVLLFHKNLIQEKKAEVEVDKLPLIKTYRAPLFQVLYNLINNALKFHKKGQHPHISIKGVEKEHEVEIQIQDNGIGVEQEYFDKIFVIFQKLEEKPNGSYGNSTGIGLPVVKKNIETIGGKVWLTSQPNKGSTFYFTIPKK